MRRFIQCQKITARARTPSLIHARMRAALSSSYFWMLPQKNEKEGWHVLNRKGWIGKKEGGRIWKEVLWNKGDDRGGNGIKEEDIHIVCWGCVCVSCGECLSFELCWLAVWRVCYVEGFPWSASFIFGGSCWTIDGGPWRCIHTHTHAYTQLREPRAVHGLLRNHLLKI